MTRRMPVCYSIAGYLGDRTPQAMAHAPLLAMYLAERARIGHRHAGRMAPAADLGWQEALARSRPTLDLAYDVMREARDRGDVPIVVGSRCALALATIPALLKGDPEAVLVWFDAHGDLNTPKTSLSGYLGGMALSALVGAWDSSFDAVLSPDRVMLIGPRDLDPAEEAYIEGSGLPLLAGTEIENDLDRLERFVSGRRVCIHLDTDVFDPSAVSAEYSVPNGLAPATIRSALETIAGTAELVALQITECSPAEEGDRTRSFDAIGDAITPLFPG